MVRPRQTRPASRRESLWSGDRIRRNVCGMPEPGKEPWPKPSPGALLSNWTTHDAPSAVKLRMAWSNTSIKLRHRQACCGNNGQPAVECRPIRPVRADTQQKTIRTITTTGTTTITPAKGPDQPAMPERLPSRRELHDIDEQPSMGTRSARAAMREVQLHHARRWTSATRNALRASSLSADYRAWSTSCPG